MSWTAILLIAFAYLVVTGLLYPYVLRHAIDRCPFDRHATGMKDAKHNPTYRPCKQAHMPEAVLKSIGAPVIIPFVLGKTISPTRWADAKVERTEAKRQAEIAEANHRKELAGIEAERTRILEQALDN